MQPRAAGLIAGVLGALLLAGCVYTSPDPVENGWCVPLVTVQPETVTAGDSVTVTVDNGCNADAPPGGWVIIAAPVGHRENAVRTTVNDDLADGLTVELQLPADFPSGGAFAGVDDWNFTGCPDSASCASPTGDFTVIRAYPPNSSADPIAASRASADAPAALGTPPDRDCGEVLLGLGESVPDDQVRCIDEAIGIATAELAVAMPTTEGDSIVYFYRTGPDIDGIRYFVDTSQDRYGSRGWTEENCPGISSIRDPSGCTAIVD